MEPELREILDKSIDKIDLDSILESLHNILQEFLLTNQQMIVESELLKKKGRRLKTDCRIAKSVGVGVCGVGGIAMVVGVALIPVTGGISLILGAAGVPPVQRAL